MCGISETEILSYPPLRARKSFFGFDFSISAVKFVGIIPIKQGSSGGGGALNEGRLYSGSSGLVHRFVVKFRERVFAPSISSVVSERSRGRF